jgi:hypothetical protein
MIAPDEPRRFHLACSNGHAWDRTFARLPSDIRTCPSPGCDGVLIKLQRHEDDPECCGDDRICLQGHRVNHDGPACLACGTPYSKIERVNHDG